jgi:lipoate-protein ligase A
MERICFLSDLLKPTPDIQTIKQVLAREFSDQLQIELIPGDLTDLEKTRLNEEQSYFQSPAWITARSRPPDEGEPIRSITQTEAGTLRVHLWLAPGGRRIRQALIAGDFFAVPTRLVNDLEAALVGVRAERTQLEESVRSFLDQYDGKIIGIDCETVAQAIASAGERLLLMREDFTRTEINELFLLNLSPEQLRRHRPRWLLLPYCSKSLACAYRRVAGCDECGCCEIGECFALARSFNMDPVTVQSFEHLMEVLRNKCAGEDGVYVGSCCEAFYSKHQREMERVNARGVLVNLDSTTCYDLGKGMDAYRGNFDNKTFLNLPLIEKTIRRLNVG